MIGGIFVGGSSSRMRSPKGLLRAPSGETLIDQLARVMRDAGLEPVLVGRRPEYAAIAIDAIEDAQLDAGPLGGLVALLEAARGERVVAVACDMPHVSAELVRKLIHAPDAPVVAPSRAGKWEPLFARYDATHVLPIAQARLARGELALQGLLAEAGAVALEMSTDDAARLVDWDTPESMTLASATAEVDVTVVEVGRAASRRGDRVAVEEPLEIRASAREPIAVTMRTPGADVDLAAGFLLGEGVVRAREDIVAIAPDGPSAVIVTLAAAARARLDRAERRFWVSSSCGLCGKATIDRVRAELGEPVHDDWRIAPNAIVRMPDALRAAQSAFDRTGALHAAGLFDERGELVRTAEDVGRHNALDKVLGAELLAGHLPLGRHAVCLSGRIAFELVQKAALAGVSAIVAIGAPTSLAVELAKASNITLVGFARDGRFNVYAGETRLEP